MDSDWAGCADARWSSSGGLVQLGRLYVKYSFSTQAIIASSSGEAEYASLVKGAGILLVSRSMLVDIRLNSVPLELQSDSAAAIGVAARTGPGRSRHLQLHLWWMQEYVRSNTVCVIRSIGISECIRSPH